MHTLIIGGGLGGLCLAQGLRKSGMSVAVYERDMSVGFRGQGYRIGIKDAGSAAVRDQLLPDSGLDELGRFIYGRTPFADDVPDVLINTFNQMTDSEGVSMSVATCRKHGTASHLTDIADYFAWTVRTANLTEAEPSALHAQARSLLGQWHPAVRRIVDEADIPATFLVTVDSARPVPPWDVQNVTLLGDAIHTMSPGRGEGANTALRDAAVLRRTLAEGAPKARYEEEMLRYGFEAVTESRDKPLLRRTL